MQAGSVDSELQDMKEGDWDIAASRTEKSCGVLNSRKKYLGELLAGVEAS